MTILLWRTAVQVIPVAEGPQNLALAAEIADGGLPLFTPPERIGQMYGDALAAAPAGFDIAAMVSVIRTGDLAAALRAAKTTLGFYIGGMGAPRPNFHLDIARRLGLPDPSAKAHELFLPRRLD